MESYLQNNHRALDLDKENFSQALDLLEADLEGKEIFFTGETHGLKVNKALEMRFIEYFKEKTDFRYYLMELPYSNAYFYNKYLETGDMKILEEMYRPLKGTYEWSKESYGHWENLYEYNKTLSEDRKLIVVGVDIEHQIYTAFRYLIDVLPDKEAPQEIREKLSYIEKLLYNLDENLVQEKTKELLIDMEDKEDLYKEYLGEDFFGFKLVNENIINSFKSYEMQEADDWNNTRDKFIYENFLEVHKQLAKGKYFGQWGLNHAYQAKEDEVMWFGSYLNSEGSKFKDKILTIAYIYDDCRQMGKCKDSKYEYKVDSLSTILEPIKEANDKVGGDIILYKLTEKDSPFYDYLLHELFESKDKKAKATDFFQYIVCIKNSEATEPLNDNY